MAEFKLKRKWVVTLGFLCFILFCSAQEQNVYDGAYSIGDYVGNAKFEYKLQNEDTLFNGTFEFDNTLEKEAGLTEKPIIITGYFKNNRPDGKWSFEFGNFSRSDEKKLVNYQYVIEINGIQKKIDFNLNEGKPSGKWSINIDSLKNSKVTKTLFKSVFDYKNGIPQKSFRIENDDAFMVGRLLRNAVAHDVWSVYTKDGIGEIESWQFNQGQLEKIVVKIDDEVKQLPIYYGNPEDLTTVNLDKHYLDIIELQIQQQDTSHVFDHGMSTLLKKDDENYDLVLHFFENLGRPLSVEGFKVVVPVFPLTTEQKAKMELIKKAYQKSDTTVQGILEDSQLNILKLSDPETAYLYNVASTIDRDYLKSIGKLVSYQDQDVLRHITRQKVIEALWPQGFPEQIMKIKDSLTAERIYVLEKSFYDFSQQNLNGVLQLAEFTTEVSLKLKSQLDEILSSNQREAAFVQQEKQLVTSVNSLKAHIDSLKNDAPKDIKTTLEQLKGFTNKKLSEYSKMEENFEKLKYSQELLTCFESAENLANAINNIPEQQSIINKAYQDQVWNPFTATIMDEDIKKRITRAYEKQVLPYYLNEIAKHLTCEKIPEITKNLRKLNDRMLALRDEDTKKLERKLRRTEDPKTILKLFELSDE